jgi:predicted NAD/FAD-binding protein
MTAAIWSTAPNSCSLNFPALTLVRFMHNHHLLQVNDRPSWLTIKDGAKLYIDSVIKKVKKERVHVKSPVTRVIRRDGKVFITATNREEEFDHVIFATHADTSLKLLKRPSVVEQDVLGNFEFSKNVAVLHSDLAVRSVRVVDCS